MDAPEGVVVYDNPLVFLADSRGRTETPWALGDLGGWDVAEGFRLAELDLPGESEWRIAVDGAEIYAALIRLPLERTYTFDGPVWLIDHIPARLMEHVPPGQHLAVPVRTLMGEVEALRREPDSLLTAVRIIQDRLPHLHAG